MNDIIVRLAKDDELSTVAKLRWQWLHENEGTPVTTREEFLRRFVTWARENEGTPVTTREEFLRRFVTWARQNAFSHRCMVMVRGDVVLGMAWLAITQRVPSPLTLERASGDVQCVYVVPDERDNGLGGRLIDAVLNLARDLGLERVTAHSSTRAVPAYSRHGFVVSPRLLQADVTHSSY